MDPDYTIALLTSYSMPENGLTQLEECITPYADDRNGDGKVVVRVSNYVFSQDTSDYTQQEASLVRFIADANENQSIIYLHDEDGFEALASSDNLEGFFQYNDGTAMPQGADDFENAMVSWEEVKAFDEFVPRQRRAICTIQTSYRSCMAGCGFLCVPRKAVPSRRMRKIWSTTTTVWLCSSA